MRIGIDATPLLGARTGVGWYTYELVSAMAADAPADDFVLFPISWRTAANVDPPAGPNVRVVQRFAPARPLWLAWRWLRYPPIERFVDCDVFHATNFIGPPSRRVPLVVTVHDLSFIRHPETCDADVLAMAKELPRVLRRSAAVITVSEFAADELREWLPAVADRVHVVYNGPHARPAPDAANLPAGVSADDRFVLFLGKLGTRKNLGLLTDAFARLRARVPGLKLVLAGPPDESAPVATGPDVVVTGYLDDAAVSALLDRAAVFAFPSLYEGFGMPVVEAMAAGAPVVAARSRAALEVAGDAALFVDAHDPDDMAGALERILTDDGLPAQLVAAGRARSQSFTWKAAAAETRAVYAAVSDARA